MSSSLTVAKHRANLQRLREETEAGIATLQASYEELDPEEAASDVGAGEDEGGSEGDLTRFERDYFAALSEESKGNVSEMARRAGMERAHVRAYLRRHGIGAKNDTGD